MKTKVKAVYIFFFNTAEAFVHHEIVLKYQVVILLKGIKITKPDYGKTLSTNWSVSFLQSAASKTPHLGFSVDPEVFANRLKREKIR